MHEIANIPMEATCRPEFVMLMFLLILVCDRFLALYTKYTRTLMPTGLRCSRWIITVAWNPIRWTLSRKWIKWMTCNKEVILWQRCRAWPTGTYRANSIWIYRFSLLLRKTKKLPQNANYVASQSIPFPNRININCVWGYFVHNSYPPPIFL